MTFVAAFLLVQRKYWKYFLGLILVIFSGKRMEFVTMVAILLLYLYDQFYSFFNLRRAFFALLILIVSFYGIQYLFEKGHFQRFEATMSFDFRDENKMFRATGGRWSEITSVANYLQKKPTLWITGAGMGESYLLTRPDSEEIELRHYVHFSPMSYLFFLNVKWN